jgi:hypothetical protein
MAQFRIGAHGRTYFCDADNIAAALAHFHANVEGADARSIAQVSDLPGQTGQTVFPKGQTSSQTRIVRTTRKGVRR